MAKRENVLRYRLTGFIKLNPNDPAAATETLAAWGRIKEACEAEGGLIGEPVATFTSIDIDAA